MTAPKRIGGSNKLVSASEVADQLGMTAQTVYDRHEEWGLPVVKIGRTLRFAQRDVDAFIESRKRAA